MVGISVIATASLPAPLSGKKAAARQAPSSYCFRDGEAKRSENGQANLRYRAGWKGKWLERLQDRLRARMPYCRVRYAF
jgi:hypothetical protein